MFCFYHLVCLILSAYYFTMIMTAAVEKGREIRWRTRVYFTKRGSICQCAYCACEVIIILLKLNG